MSLSSIGCQTKSVEIHRKLVTICTDDEVFGNALRILLDDFDVSVVDRLGEVPHDCDAMVYRVDGDRLDESLADLARSIPTLVLGRGDMLIPSVDANCRGFLLESAPLEEVGEAIVTILDGGAVVPPDLLGTLLRHLVDRRRETIALPGLEELTEREMEVFRLAAQGARKEEIGEALFISPATARTHLQRVYAKLDVHSQAELIALASRAGELREDAL